MSWRWMSCHICSPWCTVVTSALLLELTERPRSTSFPGGVALPLWRATDRETGFLIQEVQFSNVIVVQIPDLRALIEFLFDQFIPLIVVRSS